MKNVWIIEEKIDGEVAYFLAAESEFKGLKQALSVIIDNIIDSWNMEDVKQASFAKDIYNKSKSQSIDILREAVTVYNTCSHNREWNVFRTEVHEPTDIQELDDSFFSAIETKNSTMWSLN